LFIICRKEKNLNNFSIRIFSCRKEKADAIVESLKPIPSKHFDGTGYDGFSKLINHCINDCENETVILIADKMKPKKEEIYKMINLLESGFALVNLHLFAFFAFKKQLIREIGFWDERFRGGEMSDCDFLRRVKHHNVAIYESEEAERIWEPSTWHGGNVKEFYTEKWKENSDCDYKLLKEETYFYDLGPGVPCSWKPFNESVLIHESFKNKRIEYTT